ncbi:UvrD-helicase domain-containing protein [Butyrivibrio sp. LC3010]|uniref:UvrD-helicase domain-containing protein n=1 Tax=Butyrivibrio sp. LC3010 TaxID=1280680 RepID=UPI0003FC5423|nr:UvrD-helicase domain-containing protein [Butyrivibrio sp. LC3010]
MGNLKSNLEIDTISRNKIIAEINTNFFVEAGAGSGKTTMLVSRMVAMVEAGIDISKICAITFTKAAAGEFYERFQKALIERSNPVFIWKDKGFAGQLPAPTAESRARCEKALQNIDLCFMGTIDAFCGMVLSEHPSEAGISSDSTIVSDIDVETMYKQQYVKICDGDYGKEIQNLAKSFRSVNRSAEEVFVKGMQLLMDNRNVHFNFKETTSLDIDKEYGNQRTEIIKAVKCLKDHPEVMYDGKKESREAWARIGFIYNVLKRKWSNDFTGVLSALDILKDIRTISSAVDDYGASLGGVFEPGGAKGKWLSCSVGQEDSLLIRAGELKYNVSMTFLSKCVPLMEQAMLEKGQLTYFDNLYYLREMLKRDAEHSGKLIRYIYDRHSYFLIDEFQDTNPMQAEVFFYLTAMNPVPQWRECVPKPGSLFIVGDPKQSIYRFRSADVTSFLNVKKLFEKNGGEIAPLYRNFRSTKVLCEYYNKVFSEMLPEETEDQSKYEEIPLSSEKKDEFQGIYSYKAYMGKAILDKPDEADPVMIADLIERLVGRQEYLVTTEGDKAPRPIRYSDIMVITSSKKNLAPITAELSTREIPTRVEGDVPFGENVALREMLLIYKAVVDPEDKIALYGALNSNVLGVSQTDVMKYRQAGGSVSLSGTKKLDDKDEVVQLVQEKLEMLTDLSKKAHRLSPAALFSKIMDTLMIYKKVDTDNLEVVYYTLELIRNAEKSGEVVTLKDGAALLSDLIAGESDEERCLSLNDEKDCVHMANLHKVKGLEAPIVILAASSKKTFGATSRFIHGEKSSEGYVFALESDRGDNGRSWKYFETASFPDEKADEDASLKAEGARLVYVAATRARNALIICNSVQLRNGKEIQNSKWKDLLAAGTEDIFSLLTEPAKKNKDKVKTAEAEQLYKDAQENCALNDRNRETGTYMVENPSRLELKSKLADKDDVQTNVQDVVPLAIVTDDTAASDDKKEGAPSGTHGKMAAITGTMVHKLMEMMVSTRNKLDVSDAVMEIIREYRTPEYEPYEKAMVKRLETVANKMRSGGYAQTNGLPQDMLNTLISADEVYCEVPFSYRDDSDGLVIWNGIMDVIYCKDGQWHIIDYKTNADGSDLDTKYQAQLSAYIKAFKATTGEDADALTYHINV